MSRAVVTEEALEALVFERSKLWSSIMKNFSTVDDGQELDVSEFDNLFEGEDENSDLQDEEEEAKEDNEADAKLEVGHINATSVAELTMILCAGEDNKAKAEIEEILNQTVPVVEEHKRKWREAGLDRILDTFDEKQIEHHVGHWMRRHNSVYINAEPPKYLHPHGNSISDQSDESLHSIDTARYIQQSRRRNAHMTTKNPSLTTIKMYRKHSHKRDELRAKYAYDDEQEHRHHMQALLHRRREKERKLAYLASTPMHCTYSSGHQVRRKHLRKRRNNSWMFESSSDSDDDPSFSGCDCHACRRHQSLSRTAYQYFPYGRDQREYHHRQAASRTMHTMRRHHTFDMDMDLRPRLPENECSCCNSDRLCSNFVHIANSSTEEWVVENRNSPLVVGKPAKSRKHKQVVAVSPQSVRSKCHKQRLQKTKSASTSKLPTTKANYMFDSDTSDEEARKPMFCHSERTKVIRVAPIPVAPKAKMAAKKAIAMNPKSLPQIKEEEPTPGRNKNVAIPISESSDESAGEIKRRKKIVSFSEANSKSKKTREIPQKSITAPIRNVPPVNEQEVKSLPNIPSVEKGNEAIINPKKESRNMILETTYITVKDAESNLDPIGSGANKNTLEEITSPLITEKENALAEKDNGLSNKKKAIRHIKSGPTDTIDEEVMDRKCIVSLSEANTKSKRPAKKSTKPITILAQKSDSPPIPEETNTNIPEVVCINSSLSSCDLKEERLVVPRRRTKKNSENATGKTSTTALKKARPNSLKKKTTSPAIKKLPQITEEAPIRSPDSQTNPESNPTTKCLKTNVKKPENSSREETAKDVNDIPLDSEEELQRALALSKVAYKEEQQKRRKTKKQESKEQPQSPAEQSLAVFNNQSVTCNSTAVANDTACNRVLPKRRAVKRVAAVSTTEEQTSSPTGMSVEEASATGGDPDCTVVTSTTCCEPSASEPNPPPIKLTKRGILLHSSSEPGASNFTLTEQGLGKFIGDRWARKYLKYHIGSRSFDSRHSVYYQPTPQLAAALTAPQNAQSLANISSSSASDDDIFDQINRYGTVYSVFEKKSGDK
nr:flocculation protein FLO11 [Drosophila suzukii]